MRPRNDFILIRRVAPEALSPGGIHLPDMSREKRMESLIEALGPGAFLSSGVRCPAALSDLHIGDRVIVSKYGGVAVEGHDDLFLVRETEVIMVLDPTVGGKPATSGKKEK